MPRAKRARSVEHVSRSIHHAPTGPAPARWRGFVRPLTPMQLGVDIAVAIVLLLVTAPFGFAQAGQVRLQVVLAVSVLMAVALAVRRLSPAVALAVAWLAAIMQMASGMQPALVDLAVFGVLYATAAYGNRIVLWLGFASTLLGAAAVTLYVFAGPTFALTTSIDLNTLFRGAAVYVAVAFAFALSWTVGLLVRTTRRAKRTKLAQAEAEHEVTVEQERGRIARDMHDVVAHSLAVVIAQADGARYAAKTDPDATTAALETIASTARSALTDVRLLLTQLRHSESAGPQPTLADLEQLYAQMRAAGVDIRIEVDPIPPGTPPAAIQLAVFRILQEALTNALRHGDGGAVWVRQAWHPDHVTLEVRNGIAPGRAASGVGDHTGHGLIGMGERAALVGGYLHAADDAGQFIVSARLPIGAPA